MTSVSQPDGANSPSQQLGAVPGTAVETVPGYRDSEPESNDGEFASSAEADIAPRDNDWDEELPDDVLQAARQANFGTTREPENLDDVGLGADYGDDFAERVDDLRLRFQPVGRSPLESAGGGDMI